MGFKSIEIIIGIALVLNELNQLSIPTEINIFVTDYLWCVGLRKISWCMGLKKLQSELDPHRKNKFSFLVTILLWYMGLIKKINWYLTLTEKNITSFGYSTSTMKREN